MDNQEHGEPDYAFLQQLVDARLELMAIEFTPSMSPTGSGYRKLQIINIILLLCSLLGLVMINTGFIERFL